MTKLLYGDEDLRTALFAAIVKAGGTLDISFEEFGEAALMAKIGDVRPAVERTANGLRLAIAPKAEG